ncbi:hypothetical protein CHS0354_034386 [Potamilus streckersoni]|uniref:NACHT domain-containing protein n=1 Tax=Potamilus streckersoni TaxID=2493646 RepID=A0AAE0WEI2_9BIVA|nr:hypothetical protein CHS0354_034386 [Potamilus streckersoni]
MSVQKRFKKKKYRNWVKCSLALVLMKEGLHDYVHTGVKELHKEIEQKVTSANGGPSIGQTCGLCTWQNVCKRWNPFKWYIICRNSVCDKWLSQILAVHYKPDHHGINWKNANISSWPTEPYEIAKVYMPKGQDIIKNNLPKELDAQAVLSLLQYCTLFRTKIPNVKLLSDLIEVRNTVLHSGELKISDSDKDLWIDKMIQLLSDLNISSDTQSELNKLKCEDIDMNFREIEIRALQNLVSSQERAIAKVKGEITSLQNIQIQHFEERAKDMEEMKKCLIELKTISDKMVNFIDENQDLDKEIIGNFRKVEKYVHDLQNKFCQLEERVSSLEKDQEDTKEQLANHEEKIEDLEKNQQEIDRRLDDVEKKREKDNELVHQKEIESMQKDLKSGYKNLCSIPISPFDEEETEPLQDLYIDVMIEYQTEGKNTMNGNSKDRKPKRLSSCKEIFFDNRHQRIILTGLSGSGKSVFCRNIVQTWSTKEPNKQNEYAQERDLSITEQRVMAEKKETGHTCIVDELDMCDPQSSKAIATQNTLLQFKLLFYICAPKIAFENKLTDILCNQCIQRESDHLSKFFKEQPEKVLIIIDGIDEMKGEMPSFLDDLLKRKLHPRIIVLMVMRPWKISQLKLKPSSHYDLLLEVQGMSDKKALEFVQKMINVCRNYMTVERLDPSPEEKKVMSSFKKTPLLLMFLARIWCQDQTLPKRQQDLYRKILECVIERFLNKTGSKYLPTSTAQDTISIQKEAFWEMHMESACRVAHHFLLQGVSGSSVVMSEMDLMKQFEANGSNEAAQLKLSALLGCGILSKLDAFSPLGQKNVFVAFLHLSVQEYLTSMHLVYNEDAFRNFLKSLKTLNDVLRYENLFIFICGLDAEKGHIASERVCEVCDDDPHVRQYRRGRDDTVQTQSSICNLNDMYSACLNEMDNQSLVKITDIHVDNIERYNNLIPKLEPGFVKSLELSNFGKRHDEENVVIYYNYIHLEHLVLDNIKLHNDVINLSSLTKLTYLKLNDVLMSEECSRSLCSSIKSCIHLERLNLKYIILDDGVIDLSSLTKLINLKLTHVIMSEECSRFLCSSIKSCIHLERLDLGISTLHDGVIDLSSLTKLTYFKLNDVLMSEECSRSLCSSIKSCIHLERLELWYIILDDGVIDLSSLTKLINLKLTDVTMTEECSRSLYSSIKSCIHLEDLHLNDITLHDGVIDLSSLTKLTCLKLEKVFMTMECSRSLCSSIKSCIHLERLELWSIILDDGVIDLSSLTKLTYLILNSVYMTEECRRSLCSSIKSCIHLERLDLENIKLDDGVIDLSSLTKLTCLILLRAIMSVECGRSLCSSIKSCIHLGQLYLGDITLHDGVIDLSSLTELTNLILHKVTMSEECSRSLCSSIKSSIHLDWLKMKHITLHDGVIDLSNLSNLSFLVFNNVTMSPHCRQTLQTSRKSCHKLIHCII